MAKMTGAEAIVDSLQRNGVDTVFALPGGQLDHLFDAMYKQSGSLRLIHSRHEQGAAYMAYGYAKSTGRVGVCSVVPGPGLLNASAALCTAWANYAPVLVISGQIPLNAIGKGYGELHEIGDQLGMIRHIMKYAERITHPAHAPAVMREAFKQLTTGCPRTVEVEMPMDVMAMTSEVEPLASPSDDPVPLDETLIDKALKVMTGAKKPMIVIGSGALESSQPLLDFAEALQIPVMACRSGKGVISSDHYLSVNFPTGYRLWADTDAVLAIGTRLHWPLTMWGKDNDLQLVRVDIDPAQIERICKPEIGIVGDASAVLRALNDRVKAQGLVNDSREQELSGLKAGVDEQIRSRVGPQMKYLDVIREELPDDGIFVDEVTQVGFVSWYGFPVYKPRQHISAGYQGTLGYGYATALGVMAGNMDKKVIQISGDGGFLFTVQEIATAVQYELPLVSIVFNDNRYTNVQRQQKEWFDGRVVCSDLHNPNFVKLAESFGALGFSASDPESLRMAIRSAFEANRPSIIEVKVNQFFSTPWPFIMMPQNRKQLVG